MKHGGDCDGKPIQINRAEYNLTRNEYVKIRSKEININKNIAVYYIEEPKLFYRCINGRMKYKELKFD